MNDQSYKVVWHCMDHVFYDVNKKLATKLSRSW